MKDVAVRDFDAQDDESDRKQLLAAFLDIWNAEENLQFLSFTLRPFEKDIVRGWLVNHKDHGGRFLCAVDADGRVLGISVVKIDPVEGFEIHGLGVRPGFKRQGIGRKLLERTIDLAAELDFKSLDTAVFADNPAMLRALLSMDFLPIGMTFHKRADGADILRMRRRL